MAIKNKNEQLINTMRVFLGLVIWFAILELYLYFISPHIDMKIPKIYSMCISTMVVPYAIAMPILWLVVKGLPTSGFNSYNKIFSKVDIIKVMIIQSGISVLAVTLVNMLIVIIGHDNYGLPTDLVKENIVFYLFLLLIFNPIFEEILFRKIILSRLLKYGEKYAILVSAIFFALPHAISQGLPQMVSTFILGCVWAYITIKTGKITLGILLHTFSNLWGMFIPMMLIDSKVGIVVYMVIWVVLVPSIAIFLLIKERKNKQIIN